MGSDSRPTIPDVGLRIVRFDASGVLDLGLLAPAERARLATFGSAERRRQFALGRIAARSLLADVLGGAPSAAPLAVAADGAPAPPAPGRYLSIAHGGRGLQALGVAALASVPVGVDAEAIAPRPPDLWRRILRDDERGVLDALGGPDDARQSLLWALKEAVLKGQRTGLRAGARSVRLAWADAPLAAGVLRDAGTARAHAEASGSWRLRYHRDGDVWIAVAWK